VKNYPFLFLFVCSSGLFSQKTHVSLTARTPYCGGAKPSVEMAAGITRNLGNYYLVVEFKKFNNSKSSEWSRMEIARYENGNWSGKIPKKCYLRIFLADQMLSVPKLKVKYAISDSLHYALKDDSAIEQWKSRPVFEKTDKKFNKFIKLELLETCFLGLNPCYKYIGPKPR